MLVVGVDPQRVAVDGVPDVRHRRVDDVRRRDPLPLHRHRGGVDARHVEDAFEQPRQADQLGDRGVRLRAALVGRQIAARFSTATRIAVSGVLRSWLSDASSVDASSPRCRWISAASRSSRNCARSIGNAGALLRGGRQVAADDGRDQKRQERDPVVRLGNRERADRREEKIIERQRRGDRHGDRDPQRPERRREQHQDQQHEAGRRRIDAGNQPQQRDRPRRPRRSPRRRARSSRAGDGWARALQPF